ncbi:hypothetical protein [Pseudobdellovibrio exovorus]|nr:hypothetical protein [Pseudobdellovibrio exovorus]
MKKELFEGEEIIRTWKDCVLTNKRVWRHIEVGGLSEYRGFPLHQFQGATVGKVSYTWMLIAGFAAIVLAIFSLMMGGKDSAAVMAFLLILGGVFLYTWHRTKRAQVFFGSSKVEINVNLHANERDFQAAVGFVADIEMAATTTAKLTAVAV